MIDIPRSEFAKHLRAPFDPKDSINNLLLLYATTRTYRNIALDLLATKNPDVLAVYFGAVGVSPRRPGLLHGPGLGR